MGLTQSTSQSKIFLSIGYGKIRQRSINGAKVTETTPGAVYRSMPDKPDKGSWAIEYDGLIGRIINIYFKESKDFGNSYDVIFDDENDLFQVSFKEDQIGFSFLKKLPNIDFNEYCELKTYGDFITKDGKKVMAGINLTQRGQKILSAYEAYSESEKKWNYFLGFPEPEKEMNWKDKDDRDIYNAKIKKFFKTEFATKWKTFFEANNVVNEEITVESPDQIIEGDDAKKLPF